MTVWNVLGPFWFGLSLVNFFVWIFRVVRLAVLTRGRPFWLIVAAMLSLPVVTVTWVILLPLAMLPRFRNSARGTIGFERLWCLLGVVLGHGEEFWRSGMNGRRITGRRRVTSN